jgi:carboxylesterase type B
MTRRRSQKFIISTTMVFFLGAVRRWMLLIKRTTRFRYFFSIYFRLHFNFIAAPHGCEMPYVYSYGNSSTGWDQTDQDLANLAQKLWVNFVKYG